MPLVIKNPIDAAAEITPFAAAMSPNVAFAWDMIAEDFKPVIERMFLVLLANVPEKGFGWRGFDDIQYYLQRLDEEIEEFRRAASSKEAADIANFGMMLVYTMLKREG
jgi:hypothetical protein